MSAAQQRVQNGTMSTLMYEEIDRLTMTLRQVIQDYHYRAFVWSDERFRPWEQSSTPRKGHYATERAAGNIIHDEVNNLKLYEVFPSICRHLTTLGVQHGEIPL